MDEEIFEVFEYFCINVKKIQSSEKWAKIIRKFIDFCIQERISWRDYIDTVKGKVSFPFQLLTQENLDFFRKQKRKEIVFDTRSSKRILRDILLAYWKGKFICDIQIQSEDDLLRIPCFRILE